MDSKPEPKIEPVPKKTDDETYEQMKYRVACHNSNFMIHIEARVKQWAKKHKGVRPPIFQDDEGKLWWQSRKDRRKLAAKNKSK